MPKGIGSYGSKRGRPKKSGAAFNRKKYNKSAAKRKPAKKTKTFENHFNTDLWGK